MKDSVVRVLRWSERYTKTDMVYLVKNSGWVLFGQLATSLSAFLVMVVLANVVDKGDYGEYRFLLSVILILAIFTLPGLNTALSQSTARGNLGQLPAVISHKIRWGLVGSAIALVMSAYYWSQGNSALGASFVVVGLCIPFYNTFFAYYAYLQGKQLFNQTALLQIFARVVFMIVMVAAALAAPSPVVLISAYFIATIAMQYVGYRITLRKHDDPVTTDEDMVAYGKYLTLYNGAPTIVATQIGTIAIWYFLGDVEAAIYAIAMMIPLEANRFGAILNQVAMPKMSQQNIDVGALLKKILKLEIILAGVWAMYALLAPWLFSIFFPQYPEAVPYTIVAMLMVLLVPKMILRGFLVAQKMKHELRILALSVAGVQIILTIALIPLFNIWGAVAANLAAWAIELFSLLILLQYRNNFRY